MKSIDYFPMPYKFYEKRYKILSNLNSVLSLVVSWNVKCVIITTYCVFVGLCPLLGIWPEIN